jgi:adenosylcobinamide-phosphate synthase
MLDDHWIGDGRETANAQDIRTALRQYRIACAIQFACVAGLAAAMAFL